MHMTSCKYSDHRPFPNSTSLIPSCWSCTTHHFVAQDSSRWPHFFLGTQVHKAIDAHVWQPQLTSPCVESEFGQKDRVQTNLNSTSWIRLSEIRQLFKGVEEATKSSNRIHPNQTKGTVEATNHGTTFAERYHLSRRYWMNMKKS